MSDLQCLFPTLGFLGAGNMATAIIRATVGRGLLAPETVQILDVVPEKTEQLHQELNVQIAADPAALARSVSALVLAVKPQTMDAALASLRDAVNENHLVISIAAGIPAGRIARGLRNRARVVRVMPNTPALIGCGAAGVAAGPGAGERDVAAVTQLFGAMGIAVPVAEEQLDAVTALSGSGPAYVFRVMEILREAGEEMGLARDISHALTLQTVLGAARLASESGEDPAVLRQRVTSPGGTTEAALGKFDELNLAGVFKAGVHRARDRSRELAGHD
ncbi:MAG: Pyrroline-5-carboxylate reductase [candidate division BRC1 bacterium ADurb.BinA292]|nr:MAG: Pyrroline-5-carboxylate reductase [candidate division BRC1 bacterium ADurb.BinA292]HOR26543.1 pyrroline-5-carboxylate reductase [Candidatus Sumerlaeota bacterium]